MSIFSGLAQAATLAPSAPEAADFFSSPLARSVLVTFFFVLAALFLRFLYGPNGKLREKRWDEMNSEFKAAAEQAEDKKAAARRLTALQKELEPLLEREGRAFRAYVEPFYTGDEKRDELYRLKDEHSHGVFRLAWSIIQGEPELQQPQAARATLLSALYHDIGRFEQLRLYHSFNDRETVRHSALGAKLLADRRFMADETPEMRRIVRAAVALHSGAALPARLVAEPGSTLALAARALRDADKLDILRVMQEALRPGSASDPAISYSLPEEAGKYSPVVAKAVLEGRSVLHADMRYRNDFRLYVCCWVNFLEFGASLRLLARSGHLEQILGWLPEDEFMNKVRGAVKNRLSAV